MKFLFHITLNWFLLFSGLLLGEGKFKLFVNRNEIKTGLFKKYSVVINYDKQNP